MQIMKWRNEQIYHLRQDRLLTETDQDLYFKNVIGKEFEKEKPDQILFSYLKNNDCVGYGGLVHLSHVNKNAELSFVMDTTLEETSFGEHWTNFLKLITLVAFDDLGLHKIFTYAYDLRPKLYPALEDAGFFKEAVLKEHVIIGNELKDVIIHALINPAA